MALGERTQQDDWHEYKRLVLELLERSDKNYKELSLKVGELALAIVMLKTQASMWGALWGAVGGIFCSVVGAIIITHIRGQ